MRDALEHELAARLHALGEVIPEAVDAPASLDMRVRRRRRVHRRRKAATGVAAAVVLIAGIAIVAAVSAPPPHPGVHVATPGRVTADQIDPSVVLLDAKDRFVVGLDAGGHQRETLVATTKGRVIDAQVTADHTTIWYLTVTGKAGIDCGNVVRANVTTGASHVMFRAVAFAINPAGTRVALSGQHCTPSTNGAQLSIVDVNGGQGVATSVARPPALLRWAPDGATIAAETCVIIVCSVSTYESTTATRIATMPNATAPVFGGDALYVARRGNGREISVVRTDAELRALSTIYSGSALSLAALPTSAGLFVYVGDNSQSRLVSLGPGSSGSTIATPVRTYEYGTLVPVAPLG
jgi:hypothetical protein